MKDNVLNLTAVRISVVLVCLIIASTASAQSLPTWMGSFSYQGTTYNYTMVGTAPSTQTSTTIQAFVVPVKLVFSGCVTLPCSFAPTSSIVSTVTSSPVFDSTTDYTQGGVDLGTTQYIDAFQRGNFWGIIGSSMHPGYHLLLGGPRVLGQLTITVPSDEGCVGSTDYGYPAGEVDDSWLITQLENYASTTPTIQPNTLPIFLTYDAVITIGSPSCDGISGPPTQGVHFSNSSGQTYVQFGYLDPVGHGAHEPVQPDVSILSHEVGEWADDPFGSNYPTPCGTNLEVGDPLIGHNHTYTLGTVSYNLQDLAFLPYFGAPTSTSVNGWFSFQGENDNNGGTNIPCGNFH